jgi:hypothetical protein
MRFRLNAGNQGQTTGRVQREKGEPSAQVAAADDLLVWLKPAMD